MPSKRIAQVAIPLPVDSLFDYVIPATLIKQVRVGSRVRVPFQNSVRDGYVVVLKETSKIKDLKYVESVLDDAPIIPIFLLRLARSIHRYYCCSLGEAIEAMLPNAVKRSKNIDLHFLKKTKNQISKDIQKPFVYVQSTLDELLVKNIRESIQNSISASKQIIVVVSNLKKISFLSERLALDNCRVEIWHGRLGKKQMLNVWFGCRRQEIDVLIGSRSCLFAPLERVDQIIVVDEGSDTFKDDQVPYYHARQIAFFRSKLQKCRVIFTDIIPSSELLALINSNRKLFEIQSLQTSSSVYEAVRPNYHEHIDFQTEQKVAHALSAHQSVVIFHNRRGFSTYLFCKRCKKALQCDNCSANLRYNYREKVNECPACQRKFPSTDICPICHAGYLTFHGVGIDRLSSLFKRVFPAARVFTNNKKEPIASSATAHGTVFLTTQRVINDPFVRCDMSVVWDLDGLLNTGGYRAAEQVFRMLAILLSKTTDRCLIATSLDKSFYLLRSLHQYDYNTFYENELNSRKELRLPPWYHLALIIIRSVNKRAASQVAERVIKHVASRIKDADLIDPHELFRSKLRGKHYHYVLLRSMSQKHLLAAARSVLRNCRGSHVTITINVDPL